MKIEDVDLTAPGLYQFFNQNARLTNWFALHLIKLQIVKPPIVTGFVEQFRMGADFLYPSAIHHNDLIG